MDKAPGVLIAERRAPRSAPAPRLRLLVELEPRHRVFFRNLADLLLSRRLPRIPLTSRPAPFWTDVFVPSRVPWSAFIESMLWHLLAIVLFVWGQSRVWESVRLLPQRDTFHRSITYYPPKQSFRAAEGRAASVRPRSRVKQAAVRPPAHQPAMPVKPEQKPRLVTPPDIKQATSKLPNFPGSHVVTPTVPFSATAGARRKALSGPSTVVAPPPEVADEATARRMPLPQTSVVAPAPELAAASAGRAVKASDGMRVVPPPPSLQNAGNGARAARLSQGLSSSPGAGTIVVPPPPSVQGTRHGARNARLSSTADASSQVVPHPPSVQGASNSAGAGRLSSGLSSLSDAGPNVVPPPPSVQGADKAARDARLGAMAGSGAQVVPPPPSVQGSVSPAAGARSGSLSANGLGDASPVVPRPRSVEGAGNSGAGGPGKILEPMDPLPVDPSSTAAGSGENQGAVEELPLGLLGVVFAAPGTSFFSNFEVFVAKRRVGKDKDQLQLIKLVYEFLPYQRRLSEYDLNNLPPRVIKLRVTPDPSCDESLGQMILSDDPARSAAEYAKLPAALRSSDLTAVLPCYRTTAGDFQKAMSQAR